MAMPPNAKLHPKGPSLTTAPAFLDLRTFSKFSPERRQSPSAVQKSSDQPYSPSSPLASQITEEDVSADLQVLPPGVGAAHAPFEVRQQPPLPLDIVYSATVFRSPGYLVGPWITYAA
jgi:hypothetical protein